VRIEFGRVARISVDRLLRLIKESSGKIRLDPKKQNVLTISVGSIGLQEKSEYLREKLSVLNAV
jgi:transcription-repair coupling factor (superfamily II helicase)